MQDSEIILQLYREISKLEIDWNIKGLVDSQKKVYSLGNDSKLIGRIFEILIAPAIKEFAKTNGYLFEIPTNQNTYPDFTVSTRKGERIAIDIKSTYREKKKDGTYKKYGFALGSYNSYLRNNTKNIHYPYDQYVSHIVIGFVYERSKTATEGVILYDMKDIDTLDPPIENVDFFVQSKHKISGDKPGSGNTENIGSIKTSNFSDFVEGRGPFSVLGESVFEDYWRSYPRYRTKEKKYVDLETYFDSK